MSEMVERVANAIADAEHCDRRRKSGGSCLREKCQCYAMARAAIEEMREPIEAMSEAADNERWRQNKQNPGSESNPCPGEPNGDEYWRVMIDAALKD